MLMVLTRSSHLFVRMAKPCSLFLINQVDKVAMIFGWPIWMMKVTGIAYNIRLVKPRSTPIPVMATAAAAPVSE